MSGLFDGNFCPHSWSAGYRWLPNSPDIKPRDLPFEYLKGREREREKKKKKERKKKKKQQQFRTSTVQMCGEITEDMTCLQVITNVGFEFQKFYDKTGPILGM